MLVINWSKTEKQVEAELDASQLPLSPTSKLTELTPLIASSASNPPQHDSPRLPEAPPSKLTFPLLPSPLCWNIYERIPLLSKKVAGFRLACVDNRENHL